MAPMGNLMVRIMASAGLSLQLTTQDEARLVSSLAVLSI